MFKLKIQNSNRCFFWSDAHFFHRNIIKYCNRPFVSIEDQEEQLIANHNNVVGPDDYSINLGDFSFDSVKIEESERILSKLNGKKILIEGNHDNHKLLKSKYWEGVYVRLHLVFNDLPNDYFILDHFPLETWHKKTHGSYHLHGHVHSMDSGLPFPSFVQRRIDVGVDYHNYTPQTIHQLKKKMIELETYTDNNNYR